MLDSTNSMANSDEEKLCSAERQSFLKLTRELASLPLDQSAAVLETSAAVAGVSLRAGIEYLRAAPKAADVLQAAELRAWGELGRRLAMSDVETGITFFAEGLSSLKDVPEKVRPSLFQLSSRQITLSSSIAIDTLRNAPALALSIGSAETLETVFEVAAEIARRSAKHSAEFLNRTPQVLAALVKFSSPEVEQRGVDLAREFAAPSSFYQPVRFYF